MNSTSGQHKTERRGIRQIKKKHLTKLSRFGDVSSVIGLPNKCLLNVGQMRIYPLNVWRFILFWCSFCENNSWVFFWGIFFLGPSWRENKQKTRFERETIMNRSSRKNGGKVIFMKLILSAAGPSKSEMGN